MPPPYSFKVQFIDYISNPAETGKQSSDVPVKALRTTFFWPLTLEVPPARSLSNQDKRFTDVDMAKEIDNQIKRLKKLKINKSDSENSEEKDLWTEIIDPLNHIRISNHENYDEKNKHYAEAYAELTYFHDFIQSFLFNKQEENPVFRLFRRDDVKTATVAIQGDHINKEFHFSVERLNLYIFEAGLAFLVLELASDHEKSSQLKLNEVMYFNDAMRRAHAPFVFPKASCHPPRFKRPDSYVPACVAWGIGTDKPRISFSIKDDVSNLPANLYETTKNVRTIPPFRHWSWLLNGAEETLNSQGWMIGARKGEFTWRHVADDRLPILSTITLPSKTEYNSIREGDWMRLAYVDDPGEKKYPYAKAFVKKDWDNFTYDRFHYDQYDHEENSNESSRFLISGYSFLGVGSGWFFENHITIHMQRHYFQLMLLAQLEKNALLAFSSRISRAVSDFRDEQASSLFKGDAEERLTARLSEIERDFLQFVHLFRFTGVSNQIQPTEIFAQMRKQMALKELFDDVKTELETANAFLDMRVQQRQAKVTEQLTKVATIGVIASLAFSFLGMNVLTSADFLAGIGWISKEGERYRHLAAFFAVMAAFTGLGFWWLTSLGSNDKSNSLKPFAGQLKIITIIFAVLFVFAMGGAIQSPHKKKPDCTTLCPPKSP